MFSFRIIRRKEKNMSAIEKTDKIPNTGVDRELFVDEVLELIWQLRESDEVKIEDVTKNVDLNGIKEMQRDGLIKIEGKKVCLTDKGEKRARDITRRHRLAERLFVDVLDLTEYETEACKFEHAISPGVEDAICTFLGHPPTCPHGKPIPKGKCCATYTQKIQPLVQRLIDIAVGGSARVVFVIGATMDRLSSIGLIPGVIIKLQQKSPSYVIEIEETTIAIDEELARGIYVRSI